MNKQSLRILLADDHAVVRSGVRRLLEEQSQVAEVGEACDGDEAFRLARAKPWNVLVLDIGMPGRDAMNVVHLLKSEQPELAILILSMYPEDQYAVRALKAGASGYIAKTSTLEEIIRAILIVANGDIYLSSKSARMLADHLHAKPEQTAHELLSDREFSVLRCIAEGKSLAQIAEDTHLSVKTISTYRGRLCLKLGVQNNVELARYAREHGLMG